jgi:23S rRNA (cytosine1962-C5)-methyltransferase
MRPGGAVFFSTNHQDFTPRLGDLAIARVEEITARTLPEDYRRKHKTLHRCWRLTV